METRWWVILLCLNLALFTSLYKRAKIRPQTNSLCLLVCMCICFHASGYVLSMLDSLSRRRQKLSGIEWTATVQNWNKSLRHLKHCTWAVGRKDLVWCTNFQSPLLKIYFRLSGVQSSLPLIYFRYAPIRPFFSKICIVFNFMAPR